MLKHPKRFIIYFTLNLMHIGNHLLSSTLPFFILFARSDLGLSYTDTGALIALFAGVMTVLSIPVGFYADKSYLVRFFLIFSGLAVMSFGWYLLTVVSTKFMVYVAFGIIGLGASGYHPPAAAMITDLFEADKGKALSIHQAGGMGTSALAPFLFSLFVEFSGSYISASWIVMGIGFALFLFGITIAFFTKLKGVNSHDVQDSKTVGSLGIFLTALILLPLAFTSLTNSIFKVSTTFMGLLFQDYGGLNNDLASLASTLTLGVAIIFILIGGLVTDYVSPIAAIVIASFATFLSGLALVTLPIYSNVYVLGFVIFLINSSFYISGPGTNTLLANRVPPKMRGKLFGSLFSLGQILSLITPILFGYLRDNVGIGSAFMMIFLLGGLVFILGILIWRQGNRTAMNSKTV